MNGIKKTPARKLTTNDDEADNITETYIKADDIVTHSFKVNLQKVTISQAESFLLELKPSHGM